MRLCLVNFVISWIDSPVHLLNFTLLPVLFSWRKLHGLLFNGKFRSIFSVFFNNSKLQIEMHERKFQILWWVWHNMKYIQIHSPWNWFDNWVFFLGLSGDTCFCGDVLIGPGVVNATDCSTACTDKKEWKPYFCGGPDNLVSVFTTS